MGIEGGGNVGQGNWSLSIFVKQEWGGLKVQLTWRSQEFAFIRVNGTVTDVKVPITAVVGALRNSTRFTAVDLATRSCGTNSSEGEHECPLLARERHAGPPAR